VLLLHFVPVRQFFLLETSGLCETRCTPLA
jgi:hypothetical protein